MLNVYLAQTRPIKVVLVFLLPNSKQVNYEIFMNNKKLTSHFDVVDFLYSLPEFVEVFEHAADAFDQHQQAGMVLGVLRVVRVRHHRLSRRVRQYVAHRRSHWYLIWLLINSYAVCGHTKVVHRQIGSKEAESLFTYIKKLTVLLYKLTTKF